jgi:hypothetical protein
MARGTGSNLPAANANKKEASATENGLRREKGAFLRLVRAATQNAFGVWVSRWSPFLIGKALCGTHFWVRVVLLESA